MSPEWQLDESTEEEGSYLFQNVNPKRVFVLALGAAIASVAIVYFAYETIQVLIALGIIPPPPAFGPYLA